MNKERTAARFLLLVALLSAAACGTEPPHFDSGEAWRAHFEERGYAFPPENPCIIAYDWEKEAEFWVDSTGYPRLVRDYTFSLEDGRRLPYGEFPLDSAGVTGLYFEYPTPFYKEKQGVAGDFAALPNTSRLFFPPEQQLEISVLPQIEGKPLLILPSRPDSLGRFRPCPHCPTWMPEAYLLAKMEWQERFGAFQQARKPAIPTSDRWGEVDD